MNITSVLEAVIVLALTIITTFIIPWLKTKVDAEKLEKITAWVKIAVQAAEQIYNTTGAGEAKKQYVLSFLTDKGYVVDENEIDTLIESAVLELKTAVGT